MITSGWLREMVFYAQQPEIGAVGAKLLYPDGTVQHGGVILGIGGVAGHAHKYLAADDPGYFCRAMLPQSFSAVTGACLLVEKGIFKQVDGLDEELVVAFNDVDLCLKFQESGFRNIWTPYAQLYHHESKTRGYEDTSEKKERFRREVLFMQNKWKYLLVNDAYYNKNLTKEREDFSLSSVR
ncbi:MAG: hypothetical protein KAI17_14680 [Thiotrichaceae bacterium]|nr:hypothetical protein [Thiotrichaceae bacterium]